MRMRPLFKTLSANPGVFLSLGRLFFVLGAMIVSGSLMCRAEQDPGTYIISAYKHLLLRAPTSAELQAERRRLKGKPVTMVQNAYVDVAMTPEFRDQLKGKTKKERLTLFYHRVLGREADLGGLTAWAKCPNLDNLPNDSMPEMVLIFIYSSEFSQKFGFTLENNLQTVADYEAAALFVADVQAKLERAVQLGSTSANDYYRLGEFDEKSKPDQALSMYKRANELAPDWNRPY
ncbi:MAG: DUF4214 domain-containing protein, partial [Terriglobales bacterium]